MRIFIISLFVISLVSCSKKNDDNIIVTNIDQLFGIWKWESTCGGLINDCGYSSDSHYAMIKFSNDLKLIENHNDTLYLKADYRIKKFDNISGTLILKNIMSKSIILDSIERPISIVNNRMEIIRGELTDTYKKIE